MATKIGDPVVGSISEKIVKFSQKHSKMFLRELNKFPEIAPTTGSPILVIKSNSVYFLSKTNTEKNQYHGDSKKKVVVNTHNYEWLSDLNQKKI